MGYDTVLYEVDGAVATITMNRPEVANAQNTALIDDLDAAFDEADADDAVRVVVLAGAGEHFSSGHDLKALVGQEAPDAWVAMRATPEGKFQHEKVMYFDRCMRIHDFRKPTIAAVQGSCVAAGLMLACMCDLIVASSCWSSRGSSASARPRSSCSPATASTPQRPGVSASSTRSCRDASSWPRHASWPARWRSCRP